jgi:hypothetical protein
VPDFTGPVDLSSRNLGGEAREVFFARVLGGDQQYRQTARGEACPRRRRERLRDPPLDRGDHARIAAGHDPIALLEPASADGCFDRRVPAAVALLCPGQDCVPRGLDGLLPGGLVVGHVFLERSGRVERRVRVAGVQDHERSQPIVMPCRDMAANVSAPGETHERRPLDAEAVEQRRHEFGQRARVVGGRLERRRPPKSRRIESEDSQTVFGEDRTGFVDRHARAPGYGHAVPVEHRPPAGLAPRSQEQPRAWKVDEPLFHAAIICPRRRLDESSPDRRRGRSRRSGRRRR